MPLTKHRPTAVRLSALTVLATLAVTVGLGMLGGCDFFSSSSNSCTDDIRLNVCVTRADTGPDGFVIVRETRGGASDTVAGAPSMCFPETAKEQRILVVEGGVAVDSSEWFTQAPQGTCGREPVTISFD